MPKHYLFFAEIGLIIVLLTSCLNLNAQDSTATDDEKKKGVILLPAAFYTPETSFGGGLVGIFYFRTSDNPDSKPSSIQSFIVYTLQKQILITNNFDIFIKDDSYWLSGELGYYIYPYEYYGIGTDLEEVEFYTANFFRFELNAQKKWADDFYAGPTLFYDEYFKLDINETGRLKTNNTLGVETGRLIGIGASFTLDKRNNLFSPYKGYYLGGRVLSYESKLLGDYSFTDVFFDARKYFHLDDQWETSFQLYHQSIIGQPPFYNYALMGGSKRMRGYFQGAYRDNHFSLIQGEVRHYVTKKIVASVFGGLGSVSDQFMNYDLILGSYGVGLRYEIKSNERLRIRLDYARGYQTDGIYLNINEAF